MAPPELVLEARDGLGGKLDGLARVDLGFVDERDAQCIGDAAKVERVVGDCCMSVKSAEGSARAQREQAYGEPVSAGREGSRRSPE